MDGTDGRGGKRTVTGRLSQILEVCPRLEQIEITQAVVFSLTDFANATRESWPLPRVSNAQNTLLVIAASQTEIRLADAITILSQT